MRNELNIKNPLTSESLTDVSVVNRFLYGLLIAVTLLIMTLPSYAQQMSISTASVTITPQSGVALDLSQNPGSNSGNGAIAEGFVLPCLSTGQMNAVITTAPEGLLLFNTTSQCYEIYSGSVWNAFWCLCNSAAPSVTAGATSTTVCTGSTIYLTATGGASTYSWTGPSGFVSSLQNPTVTASATPGTYTYSVTASNGCGSSPVSTISITVAAGTDQTAGVTVSPICSGNTINLTCTNTLSVVTHYSWTGPNGFTSTSQDPNISNATTAATGTYTVICTEGACSVSSTVAVTVNSTPSAPSPITESDSLTGTTYAGPACDPGCMAVGQTLNFSVPANPGYTFNWVVTNGNIVSGAGTNSISVQWTAAGTNEITVTQTSPSGCTSSTNDIFTTIKSTCSCTFSGCATTGTFTVPAGIHSLTLNVSGAEGGAVYSGSFGLNAEASGNDTYGANVQCKYATAPGTSLSYYVGCVGGNGSSTTAGTGGVGGNHDENGGNGINWAGASACSGTSNVSAHSAQVASGGGGGASCIRLTSTNTWGNDIVAAGGGGGCFARYAWLCQNCQNGGGTGNCTNTGNGGYLQENFYLSPYMSGSNTGCGGVNNVASNGGLDFEAAGNEEGLGGTFTAAGAGAPATDIETYDLTNCTNVVDTHCPGTAGSAGSNGNGGNAGLQGFYSDCGVCEYSPGGGGGGGHYGGGGGAGCGGGGGSSYVNGSCSSITYVSCSQSGNGQIIITW